MRGGEEHAADQLGVVAHSRRVGALLGRVLTTLPDLAWNAFFGALTIFQTPPPTPEQLYEQHLREREQAITEWIRTHRTEER